MSESVRIMTSIDEIQATKDLFANCSAGNENYISPKTICELIKSGSGIVQCTVIKR